MGNYHKDDLGPLIFLVCLFGGTLLCFLAVYSCLQLTHWTCKKRFKDMYTTKHVRFYTPSLSTLPQTLPNAQSSNFESRSGSQISIDINHMIQPPPNAPSILEANNKQVVEYEFVDTGLPKSTIMAAVIEVVTLDRMQKCYLYLQEVKLKEYQQISVV